MRIVPWKQVMMERSGKAIKNSIIAFVAMGVLANVPPVAAFFIEDRDSLLLDVIAAAFALLWLVLAIYIWATALADLRGNSLLDGPARIGWRLTVYGTFVFGAIAYHLRFGKLGDFHPPEG